MSYSGLGQKIKNARLAMGMTQRELCGGDITRNMLSRIETGDAYPSLETLCLLASRLGMHPGYFLDDSDDGESLRNRRLLSMIKAEYEKGNYALCLDYGRGLTDSDDEFRLISTVCSFRCGTEKLMAGELRRAAEYFDGVNGEFSEGDVIFPGYRADAKMYSVYISSFLAHNAPGEDAEAIAPVLRCVDCGNDIMKIATVSEMLKNDSDCAGKLLSFMSFSEKKHRAVCEGLVMTAKGEFRAAKMKLIEAAGGQLVPMLSVWCLSLLEKCAAGMRDFENAYAYSIRRRETVDSLVSGIY